MIFWGWFFFRGAEACVCKGPSSTERGKKSKTSFHLCVSARALFSQHLTTTTTMMRAITQQRALASGLLLLLLVATAAARAQQQQQQQQQPSNADNAFGQGFNALAQQGKRAAKHVYDRGVLKRTGVVERFVPRSEGGGKKNGTTAESKRERRRPKGRVGPDEDALAAAQEAYMDASADDYSIAPWSVNGTHHHNNNDHHDNHKSAVQQYSRYEGLPPRSAAADAADAQAALEDAVVARLAAVLLGSSPSPDPSFLSDPEPSPPRAPSKKKREAEERKKQAAAQQRRDRDDF